MAEAITEPNEERVLMTRHNDTLIRGGPRSGLVEQRRSSEHVEPRATLRGGFRVTLQDMSWWWSPGMFSLLGYRPNQAAHIVPTTALVLAHRHRDDRRAVESAWAQLVSGDGVAALHYRIVGADGLTRPVFAMASTQYDSTRTPVLISGVLQLEVPALQH